MAYFRALLVEVGYMIKEYNETVNITSLKKVVGRPGMVTKYDKRIKASVQQIIDKQFTKENVVWRWQQFKVFLAFADDSSSDIFVFH